MLRGWAGGSARRRCPRCAAAPPRGAARSRRCRPAARTSRRRPASSSRRPARTTRSSGRRAAAARPPPGSGARRRAPPAAASRAAAGAAVRRARSRPGRTRGRRTGRRPAPRAAAPGTTSSSAHRAGFTSRTTPSRSTIATPVGTSAARSANRRAACRARASSSYWPVTSRTTPISRAGSAVRTDLDLGAAAEPDAGQRQLGLVVAQAGVRRAASGPAARPARPRPARRCRRARPRSRGRAPAAARSGAARRWPARSARCRPGPSVPARRSSGARWRTRCRVRAGLARHEHDDLQLAVGDVPLEQVDRDRDVRRHQLRRGAGADDQPGEARAAQPRLGPAGEPQQRGVDLHDPVGAVQDEGGRRGGERKVGGSPRLFCTERRTRSPGSEAPPLSSVVAAGHRPDGRRCLGGRRRGALDDAQRGVARAHRRAPGAAARGADAGEERRWARS